MVTNTLSDYGLLSGSVSSGPSTPNFSPQEDLNDAEFPMAVQSSRWSRQERQVVPAESYATSDQQSLIQGHDVQGVGLRVTRVQLGRRSGTVASAVGRLSQSRLSQMPPEGIHRQHYAVFNNTDFCVLKLSHNR